MVSLPLSPSLPSIVDKVDGYWLTKSSLLYTTIPTLQGHNHNVEEWGCKTHNNPSNPIIPSINGIQSTHDPIIDSQTIRSYLWSVGMVAEKEAASHHVTLQRTVGCCSCSHPAIQ